MTRPLNLASALLTALAFGPLASCAATAESAETNLQQLVASAHVTPPSGDNNTVFVEFSDTTGEGLDEVLYDALIDKIEQRGYRYTSNHAEADYVLWATVRVFEEADEQEASGLVKGLGTIAGGAAGVGAAHASGGGTGSQVAAGVGGAVVGHAIAGWLGAQKQWMMVIDVQVGRKMEGGVETSMDSGTNSDVAQGSAASGSLSTEYGSSSNTQGTNQSVQEVRAHFETEQRFVATAIGTRLAKEVAVEALTPKLSSGISNIFARVRR